jgi:uncharacterized protein (TIGR02186 family)
MRWLALLLLLIGTPAGAQGPRLITDISQSRIDIVYSFTGAELLVFGAIQYPNGRSPPERPQIAVVVRGPAESIVVRRKERVAGIWMNTEAERFVTAPAFYAVASSEPIDAMLDERTAAIFEIGLDRLQLSPADASSAEEVQEFEHGLLDLRRRTGLYAQAPKGVEITENVLYRARISIPARVPPGSYRVETYLIRGGEVAATSSRNVEIDKTGLERVVSVAAERHGLAYGLAAVTLALLLGWGAGLAFRR